MENTWKGIDLEREGKRRSVFTVSRVAGWATKRKTNLARGRKGEVRGQRGRSLLQASQKPHETQRPPKERKPNRNKKKKNKTPNNNTHTKLRDHSNWLNKGWHPWKGVSLTLGAAWRKENWEGKKP